MNTRKNCLIIVDMQNDFVNPHGALYVKSAETIVDKIHQLISNCSWDLIILTQDFHPQNHCSFSTWPPHCVMGTYGAEINNEILDVCINGNNIWYLWTKGVYQDIDAYSAFKDNAGNDLGLYDLLKDEEITNVYICGVATDFCVKETTLDSLSYKDLNTFIISDCVVGVDDKTSGEFLSKMRVENHVTNSEEIFLNQ